MDENGKWNGVVKELIEKRADVGLGSMSVMAERENVIDFTVPYYDLVGITILMKLPETPTSLFKFLTVLENEVWLCILAAYFFTRYLNDFDNFPHLILLPLSVFSCGSLIVGLHIAIRITGRNTRTTKRKGNST